MLDSAAQHIIHQLLMMVRRQLRLAGRTTWLLAQRLTSHRSLRTRMLIRSATSARRKSWRPLIRLKKGTPSHQKLHQMPRQTSDLGRPRTPSRRSCQSQGPSPRLKKVSLSSLCQRQQKTPSPPPSTQMVNQRETLSRTSVRETSRCLDLLTIRSLWLVAMPRVSQRRSRASQPPGQTVRHNLRSTGCQKQSPMLLQRRSPRSIARLWPMLMASL
mmetsp:Transcript_13608/g.31382  ORF Transcript_13608/g.31382 Transcript_13608/m.31382 type:complete len:215 (-) Transcript_13608:603-1247(-)